MTIKKQILVISILLISGQVYAMESKASEVLALSHYAHCVCVKPVTKILLSTTNQSAGIKIQEHSKTALISSPVYYPASRPAVAEITELRISGFSEHGVVAQVDDIVIPADYNYKIADVEWKGDNLRLKIRPDMTCYIKASQGHFGEPVLSLHVVPNPAMAYHRIDVSAVGGLLHSTITCKELVLREDATVITAKHHYKLGLDCIKH